MLTSRINNRIGIITLDRPEKRNAFNAELVTLLHETIVKFNNDDNVRAILIQANGKAFSAGADLKYLQQLRANTLNENEEDSKQLAEMFKALYNSPKLTISAVNGHALAGGCGLATITDFCWATPNSNFGYTEVKIGFIPAIVLTFLLRKVDGQNLNELLLTGKIVTAQEAKDLSLISDVIDSDSFEHTVEERIQQLISSTSGQAIAKTKELIRAVDAKQINESLDTASKYNAIARSSDDCIKGVDSFLNKTKISW